MDDSYFGEDLIQQFRLAEVDYQVCTPTVTLEKARKKREANLKP